MLSSVGTLETTEEATAMAHEVTAWKKDLCPISLRVAGLSQRESFSREVNEAHGEGGALNADYQTVDAIAVAVDILRGAGLKYNVDYMFKTGGSGSVSFDFRDEDTKGRAMKALQDAQATTS